MVRRTVYKMHIKSLFRKAGYEKILPCYVDFIIPGFEKSYPRGIFKCLSFSNRSAEKWFLSFVDKVENAIGKKFLPIYRMSDGEFQFCVGYHYPHSATNEPIWLYLLRTFRRIGERLRLKLLKKNFSAGGKGYISGIYQYTELNSLRRSYVEQLNQIALQGFLAIHFTDRIKSHRKKQFQQQYFVPVLRWLNEQDIKLHKGNYCPFYFVYAMLTGPFRHRIYQGRRLLIITSHDDAKRDAIANGLALEGVADVQFLPLSQGGSMYDTINLSAVRRPVDLVLVGGGIGASNILCQLAPLNTLAIDAGYIIECLASSDCKKQRTFCWPDKERKGDYQPI